MTKDFKEAFEKTKIAGNIAAGALDEIGKIISAAIINAPQLKEILDTDWGDLLVIIEPVA